MRVRTRVRRRSTDGRRRLASTAGPNRPETRPDALSTAVVTGASSGIGAAFARQLAARGCDVILVARRETELTTLARNLGQAFRVRAEVVKTDLGTPEGVDHLVRHLESSPPHWLINNAGFGVPGAFNQVPLERSLAMIQVHVLAAVRLIHAVLPGMIARGHGNIVNVGSIGAFLPRPGDATYCATKAYLVTFSRALHDELRDTGVKVQALCPGFTYTDFYNRPDYRGYDLKGAVPRGQWMSPEEVVAASLKTFKHNRPICIPGIQNRLLVALAKLGFREALLRRLDSHLGLSQGGLSNLHA
jgi:short-subunit dehydrogenase